MRNSPLILSAVLQAMQEASRAKYTRQQSLVVDRLVDNLALEAATSYGGTRKPAVAQALKKQLHKAAQKLPSLAAASPVPLVSEPEVVVVRTAVMEAAGGAADGVVTKEAVMSTIVMEADGGAADGVVMKEAVAVAVLAMADPEVSEPLLAPIEVGLRLTLIYDHVNLFLSSASSSLFLLHAISNDHNQVRMPAPICTCLWKLLPYRLGHNVWQIA